MCSSLSGCFSSSDSDSELNIALISSSGINSAFSSVFLGTTTKKLLESELESKFE